MSSQLTHPISKTQRMKKYCGMKVVYNMFDNNTCDKMFLPVEVDNQNNVVAVGIDILPSTQDQGTRYISDIYFTLNLGIKYRDNSLYYDVQSLVTQQAFIAGIIVIRQGTDLNTFLTSGLQPEAIPTGDNPNLIWRNDNLFPIPKNDVLFTYPIQLSTLSESYWWTFNFHIPGGCTIESGDHIVLLITNSSPWFTFAFDKSTHTNTGLAPLGFDLSIASQFDYKIQFA